MLNERYDGSTIDENKKKLAKSAKSGTFFALLVSLVLANLSVKFNYLFNLRVYAKYEIRVLQI